MKKTIPNVIFKYDIEKDVRNVEIGLETIRNGRKPDQELELVIKEYGENPSQEELVLYVKKYWEGKEQIRDVVVNQLQEYWDSIEGKFFTHLADRMQLDSFFEIETLNGFLSTRCGAGYDHKEAWFGVVANNGTLQNTLTAMHEIMHIFFHKQWWVFCSERGVTDKNIWDVKEAVTVLLNLWFKNQIIHTDWGYKEHTQLRKNIIQWFLDSRDFKTTLEKACDYIKENPKKSPEWIK